MIALIVLFFIVGIPLLGKSITIVKEFERGLVFRLGSYDRVLPPGINFVIPFAEKVRKIDYRVDSVNVSPQNVMTKDNVTVKVDAFVFYHVKKSTEEVKKAVLEVDDFRDVTTDYGQSMLRAIIGRKELDDILQKRDEIADELKGQLDDKTDRFGVKVDDVEIKDVSIPQKLERAMASEAEAERERRARIKNAQGELQAAIRTRVASDLLGSAGYKLRTLQTVDSVAADNATIVTVPASLIPSEKKTEEGALFDDVLDKVKDRMDLSDILEGVEEMEADDILGEASTN